MTLKKGPATCDPEKTESKKCAKKCAYTKGDWSECSADGKKTRTDTLKPGQDAACEQQKTQEKNCKYTGGKPKCKYTKGAWSECTNGQKTRTDQLKPNSDASCEPQKVEQKKCRNPGEKCQYSKGTWSSCVDGKKTLVLSLTSGGAGCEQTKTREKSCRNRRQ
jgi:hypothetical protein